ncbi:hypothetical protein [Micromonospora sp. NPDC005173]|uniref:hypothetical protein n=1 Tax=Micromonospora sp. NPDC005173 TaxID=3157165 RepID=UPI0033BCF308
MASAVPPTSAHREANLHHRLAGTGLDAVIATTTTELRLAPGASPAEQVWQLTGGSTGRHRLIDLPYSDTHHDDEFPTRTAPRTSVRAA